MTGADIRFPHLGIEFASLETGITLFGYTIAFYGIIIAFGMMMGIMVAGWQAKRTGQDKEIYYDFAIYAIIFAILGARMYYVIFDWSEYKDNLLQILNLRGGGLAIYGGVIGGTLAALVFCKCKKLSAWLLLDTAVAGLVTGQILGRWGNFFNREAFGGYTDNLFAMQLKKSQVASSNMNAEILDNIVVKNGIEYIQVHPTFLYECLWNICVLILLIWFTKRKKKDGEIFLLYLIAYGVGRAWIESLRTDQLLIWDTNIAVSMLLSMVLVVGSIVLIVIRRRKTIKS